MRVAITGSSGLIGTALSASLRSDGHQVVRVLRHRVGPADGSPSQSGSSLSRTLEEPALYWNPVRGDIDAAGLEGVDAVVHLAGAGIGDKRWTNGRKREILDSRVGPTSLLAATLASMDDPPSVMLSGSAIGIYGGRGDELCTETSDPGSGFLAHVCQAWEKATQPAEAAGIRVVHLRTGLVQSADGGVLKKVLPLFKLGLGGRLGDGKQWNSWISITDEVGAIRYLLGADVAGPVNVTAPEPVTNGDYTKMLGRVLGRPAALSIPLIGPKLLLGSEGARELLAGQRVLPTVLEHEGYPFAHRSLESALKAALAQVPHRGPARSIGT
ncbi:MAG: TIGR01777 family oxidoreductase [Acidimicrobiales bacterium]